MNNALNAVKSKRIWFIPDFSTWGVSQEAEIDFALVEGVDSEQNLFYGNQPIGASLQKVNFSDLVDHRGNPLPAEIDSPKVIPRSKTSEPIFIVGKESSNDFNIARSHESSGPVPGDLMIIEMGS